jgi:ferric-dicitrate binding protein FerR (iron transport regulator)
MTRIALWLLTMTFAGCGGSLSSPSAIPPAAQPTTDVAVISGQIYTNALGHPPLAAARVEVNVADGSSTSVASNADGAYRITVRRGSVTVTASKEGYEAKQWQFDLLNDTVVNFSLTPQ